MKYGIFDKFNKSVAVCDFLHEAKERKGSLGVEGLYIHPLPTHIDEVPASQLQWDKKSEEWD